jgi:hypothetical protein
VLRLTEYSSYHTLSSVPGGLCNSFAAEFLLNKLCKFTHARSMSSAVESLTKSGLLNILNTEANNPNAFSTIQRARGCNYSFGAPFGYLYSIWFEKIAV